MKPSKRNTLRQHTEALLNRSDVTLGGIVREIEEILSTRNNDTIEGIDETLHILPPHIPRFVWNALGNCVMEKENSMNMIEVDGSCWISLRLDGNGFRKKVAALRKAGLLEATGYPQRVAEAMKVCLLTLMNKTSAKVGFTHSDEIIVFLPPTKVIDGERLPHVHKGRTQKLITLAAGLVSSCFALTMAGQILNGHTANDDDPSNHEVTPTRNHATRVLETLSELSPCFDCRLGVYKTWVEARGLLLWRAHDCAINGVSDAVHYSLNNQPQQTNLNTREKLKWLLGEGMLPLPRNQAYGVLMVRTKKLKTIDSPVLEWMVEGSLLIE